MRVITLDVTEVRSREFMIFLLKNRPTDSEAPLFVDIDFCLNLQ